MALTLRDRAAAGKGTPSNRRARALDAMGGRINRPPLARAPEGNASHLVGLKTAGRYFGAGVFYSPR